MGFDVRQTVIIVFLLGCTLMAQSFEVASVKPHEGPGSVGISASGPRLTAVAKTLSGLLAYAWALKSWQIADTPALRPRGDDFFDIAAKAEGDSTPTDAEFRQMMQSLLSERFRLRFHLGEARSAEVAPPKASIADPLRLVETADRPVVDETGLTGTYSIRILYTPDTRPIAETPTRTTSLSSRRCKSNWG